MTGSQTSLRSDESHAEPQSISPLLYTAARQVERSALLELTSVLPLDELRELLGRIVEVVEAGSGPLDLFRDGLDLTPVAEHLERLLFCATVSAMAAVERRPSPEETARMLGGFARLRERLGRSGVVGLPLERVMEPEMLDLAHDMRSPLSAILFLTDGLPRGQSGPLNELQQRQIGIAYGAALSLSSTVNDVLACSRPGQEWTEGGASVFSISNLFGSVRDLLQPVALQQGLTLRERIEGSSRRAGYPVALSRILMNLATNALKYTETGFVELSAQELDEDRVQFSVRDSGPGLSPEAIAQAFNPLHTDRSAQRPGTAGTRLGLLICHRLLRALGSELRFETAPGWGTRFYFEVVLPVAPLPLAASDP